MKTKDLEKYQKLSEMRKNLDADLRELKKLLEASGPGVYGPYIVTRTINRIDAHMVKAHTRITWKIGVKK